MTGDMKPWQHGYALDHLLALETRYGAYNARAAGPWAQFKKNRIAEYLRDQQFFYGDTWSYVLETTKVQTPMEMFDGIEYARRLRHDRILKYLVADWQEPSWQRRFADLCEPPTPLWIQTWAGDTHTRRHIEHVATYMGTKVTTFGEVFAWYLRGTDHQRRLRTRIIEKEHLYGMCPVDVRVQPDALLAQVDALHLSYANHYSNYNAGRSWSALSIRGYSPDITMIANPSEMNKKWVAAHKDETFVLQDTSLRQQLPAVEHMLAQFPEVTEWHRIRLMCLTPGGGELERHTDQVDKKSGFGVGQLLRLHIPLKTNPEVRFTVWNADDTPRIVHMPVGEVWALDTRWPHRAINGGSDERIHLVLDAVVTPELQARLLPLEVAV